VALAERFMAQGVDGLLRDKTRPSRIPRLPATVHERTVALTQTDPPGEVTHWTVQMMAKQVGISVSSVQRIWHTHGLQPHRVRQFKLSRDRQFVTKLRDIVGLSVLAPALGPAKGRTRGSIRRQTHTILLTHLDCNPLAHAQPPSPSRAYTMRTLLSDFIH
jgi:hypothetical protein